LVTPERDYDEDDKLSNQKRIDVPGLKSQKSHTVESSTTENKKRV
jgi:hypothetical protein